MSRSTANLALAPDATQSEARCLQYLLPRLIGADDRTVARIAKDLETFVALRPITAALHAKAASLTTAELRVIIEKALTLSPAIAKTIKADLLLAPCDDPAAAKADLAKLRASWRRQEEIDQVSALGADLAKSQQPLADALKSLRTAAARVRHTESPDPEDLFAEAVRDDQLIEDGKAGFPLAQPFFDEGFGDWFVSWFAGNRLVPGDTVLIGAGSNTGKTTVGNAIACSALSAGMPVLYWQAEIKSSRHIKDVAACWNGVKRTDKATGALPKELKRIRYPIPGPSIRTIAGIRDQVASWCDEIDLERDPSVDANPCRGLLIVDYIQLVDDPEHSGDQAYRRSDTVASELAQMAGERNLVVVILSQASRGAQQKINAELAKNPSETEIEGIARDYGEHCFAGSDLRRVAEVAFALVRWKREDGDKLLCVNVKDRVGGGDDRVMPYDFDAQGRIYVPPTIVSEAIASRGERARVAPHDGESWDAPKSGAASAPKPESPRRKKRQGI